MKRFLDPESLFQALIDLPIDKELLRKILMAGGVVGALIGSFFIVKKVRDILTEVEPEKQPTKIVRPKITKKPGPTKPKSPKPTPIKIVVAGDEESGNE